MVPVAAPAPSVPLVWPWHVVSLGSGCYNREMSTAHSVLSTLTPERSLALLRHVVTWRSRHRARNKSHFRRPGTPPVLRRSGCVRGAWGGGGWLGAGPVGSDQALSPTSSALNPQPQRRAPEGNGEPPRPTSSPSVRMQLPRTSEEGASGVDEHGKSSLSKQARHAQCAPFRGPCARVRFLLACSRPFERGTRAHPAPHGWIVAFPAAAFQAVEVPGASNAVPLAADRVVAKLVWFEELWDAGGQRRGRRRSRHRPSVLAFGGSGGKTAACSPRRSGGSWGGTLCLGSSATTPALPACPPTPSGLGNSPGTSRRVRTSRAWTWKRGRRPHPQVTEPSSPYVAPVDSTPEHSFSRQRPPVAVFGESNRRRSLASPRSGGLVPASALPVEGAVLCAVQCPARAWGTAATRGPSVSGLCCAP